MSRTHDITISTFDLDRLEGELEGTKEELADAKATADLWIQKAKEAEQAAADLKAELEDTRREWKAELEEQARLLGMSAERECDLRGKIERLERDIAGWETKWKCAVEMAARAENERDELKEQLDAQELEMFAIRSSLSDAKAEIEEIQEQLNAYIMLDKMAMRKFIREREQERQNQCRQSPTTDQ